MTKRDLRKAARLLKDAARGLWLAHRVNGDWWFADPDGTPRPDVAHRIADEHAELVRIAGVMYAEARKPVTVEPAPRIQRHPIVLTSTFHEADF